MLDFQVDNENFQDFGISAGQKRVCTYYRYTEEGKFDQSTCGGKSFEPIAGANYSII